MSKYKYMDILFNWNNADKMFIDNADNSLKYIVDRGGFEDSAVWTKYIFWKHIILLIKKTIAIHLIL